MNADWKLLDSLTGSSEIIDLTIDFWPEDGGYRRKSDCLLEKLCCVYVISPETLEVCPNMPMIYSAMYARVKLYGWTYFSASGKAKLGLCPVCV